MWGIGIRFQSSLGISTFGVYTVMCISLSISILQLRAELEQEVKNFEEKQVRIKEVAESEVMELCRNYKHDLQ